MVDITKTESKMLIYRIQDPVLDRSVHYLLGSGSGRILIWKKNVLNCFNSSRINLHDNNLFLIRTVIDPKYKLSFFPENLKSKVKKLLKSEVKNHSYRETCQSVEVFLVPPKKPKVQLPEDDFPTSFLSFYPTFKPETSANTQESEQHDLVYQEIKT